MTSPACAFPDEAGPRLAPAPVAISRHRWSPALAALLDGSAADAPTLVVLPGGRAMLGGTGSGVPFSAHVLSAWDGAQRGHPAAAARGLPAECTVLRYDASALPPGRAAAPGAPALLVQMGPAAYFRFLRRSRLLHADAMADAPGADDDAVALLRHVQFRAWPCGRSTAGPAPRGPVRRRSMAFEAQAIMSRSLACRHPLEALARTLCTSPFHLAHVFRSEIGISLHQYLVQLRLVAALERLHAGEPDLSKLALDLGFSHHSHFSSLFRRVIGCSPRDVRRALSADAAAPLARGARG